MNFFKEYTRSNTVTARLLYIGESGRNLSTRMTEHKRATRNGDVNNLLMELSKTNNERTTGQLTIWLTKNDCLSVKIDGSKRINGITSLYSQWHHGLTDRRPMTSRLDLPIMSITEFNTISWRDTTHFDPEDDYRGGCRNVSHFQQQQSYSGPRSHGRSYSSYLWRIKWVIFIWPIYRFATQTFIEG